MSDETIVERALPYTMTGVPRLQALIDAVRHVVETGVPGAFAECGVWRGGSVLAMLLTLLELGATDRDVHLYDTFEGMPEPGERDGEARDAWRESGGWPEMFGPEAFSEDAVRATLLDTGYPSERIHVVRGRVEDTIPAQAPERLAVLRLDTDWYESTRHELEQLYPRLAPGGVLIVDDYGHWEGARRAVDEFFAQRPPRPYLHRVDYSCRVAVRP